MKSEFLKIAGVKSEKAFYKKFPTEAAFFKAHPEAKKMVNGGEQDRGQLKKLKQLTDFGNPPIAQFGDLIPLAKGVGVTNTMGGIPTTPSALKSVDLTKGATKGLGAAASYIGPALDIIGGINMLGEEKRALKQAKQDARLTNVLAQAAESRPEPIRRQYVRPEDVLLEPGQLSPAYGTGTNILAAEDGAVINQIGGNPTEIANTFAPNTIYSDMGYEPLDDSSKVKNYYAGGKLTKAQLGGDFANQLAGSGFGQFMSNPQAGEFLTNIATRVGTGGVRPTGSSQIGKGIGAAAGTAFLGPVGGVVGGALGSLVGGLFGKKKAKEMAGLQTQTSANIDRIAGQQMGINFQNQFGTFMKDGGWVSHDWQPQKITKFGEYDVDELLKPDPMMDTLRTGGNIRQNQMFDTDMFAMGGDLKVYRGEAEPMSVNPFLPDGGETIMFRGPSHEDGGMPIEYGESPVEVEGGEPAVKLRNGSTGDEDLVVFGNLIEPNSKRKFKNVVADIAKKEAKQNKLIDKSINQLDNLDVDTAFDKLKMGSLQANLMGGTMKLKNYADEKMDLAAKQSAINETAEEMGLEADALAKGKMKQAKLGASIDKAAKGKSIKRLPQITPISFDPLAAIKKSQAMASPRTTGEVKQFQIADIPKPPVNVPNKNEFPWMNIANQILPQFRPTDVEDLAMQQITPELTVLGEKEEPVYAQKFQPQLITPFDVADPGAQLDAIDMQANAAVRAVGNDPATQAFIMGQAAQLKSRAIGEAQRQNAIAKLNAYNQNVQMLNEAQARNLAIMDQQQVRQAQARSATRASRLAAQQSIANKYLQNRAEQRSLQAYENLYNFRFGDRGLAQNFNPLAQFNVPQVSNITAEELEALAKFRATQEKKNTSTAKNGSIVKAIKNL